MQIIMWLGEEKNESDPGDLLAIGVFLDWWGCDSLCFFGHGSGQFFWFLWTLEWIIKKIEGLKIIKDEDLKKWI